MSKYWNLFVLATVALSAPAYAGSPLVNSSMSGQAHSACIPGYSINADAGSLSPITDPYAHLLPTDINTNNLEFSNAYNIDLKPLRADDMSQYQFKTVDNRGLGAGYSSPYLWEVGRGPGGSMMSPSWNSPMDSRAYSPIPMPGR